MRRALAVALATAGIVLGGCRTLTPPPLFAPVSGEDERIQAWLARSRAEGEQRWAVRALGSLKLDSPSGSGRVKQVILAQRPALLRLESLNFLGQTQSLLVTDGQRFSFFDGRELLGGAVSQDVLLQYLGLDLEPADAVRVVLAAPLIGDEAPRAILGAGDERLVELNAQRLHFGPDGELLGVEVRDLAGATRWRATYQRWRAVPKGRYPFVVGLFFPRTELHAELRLDEVEVNPELDPALFRVPHGKLR